MAIPSSPQSQRADNAGSPRWLRQTDRGLDALASLFLNAAALFLVAMLVMNFINIASRNLGNGGLLWVSAWTRVMMVWCIFLSFYVVYRRGMDITLDFLVDRFPKRWLRWFDALAALCGILFCGVLVLELPQILARQRGELELVGLQRYWLSVPMILSAALLVVHFVIELIAAIFRLRPALAAEPTEQLQW